MPSNGNPSLNLPSLILKHMNPRLFPSFVVAALLAVTLLGAARGADDTVIKLSDPAKPGTLKVILARGSLRVKGADGPDVTVKSDSKPVTSKAVRKDGLRVLTAASSFSLVEKDNVVTLDAVSEGFHGGGADFTVTVPRQTTVVVNNAWGGDVSCSSLSGDIEIHGVNGEVRLDDVSGGIVVETVNGEIHANIRELRDNKPVSFQSTNGPVVVRLPSDAKATVRLRTQNGSVLTDFDETALVTKTESTPRPPSTRRITRDGKPVAAPAAPKPATAPKPGAAPKPPVAPKPGLDASDKEEIRNSTREAALAAQEAARAAQDVAREVQAVARDAMRAAQEGLGEAGVNINIKMPNIVIPTVTGGKLVTGTLNGGGPEISVATMNGDVTLRQLEKK